MKFRGATAVSVVSSFEGENATNTCRELQASRRKAMKASSHVQAGIHHSGIFRALCFRHIYSISTENDLEIKKGRIEIIIERGERENAAWMDEYSLRISAMTLRGAGIGGLIARTAVVCKSCAEYRSIRKRTRSKKVRPVFALAHKWWPRHHLEGTNCKW